MAPVHPDTAVDHAPTDAVAPGLSTRLAPEDIQVGDFVGILSEEFEYPPFACNVEDFLLPTGEPVRIRFQRSEGGLPHKVQAICLPFVATKRADGVHRVLDVRSMQLVRLTRDYADSVIKSYKKS